MGGDALRRLKPDDHVTSRGGPLARHIHMTPFQELMMAIRQKSPDARPPVADVFARYGVDEFSPTEIQQGLREAASHHRLHSLKAMLDQGAVPLPSDTALVEYAANYPTTEMLDLLAGRDLFPVSSYPIAMVSAARSGSMPVLKRMTELGGYDWFGFCFGGDRYGFG